MCLFMNLNWSDKKMEYSKIYTRKAAWDKLRKYDYLYERWRFIFFDNRPTGND